MFSRSCRMNTRIFKEEYTHSQKVFSPFFRLAFVPKTDSRFAVVVPKKITKKAFARNRQRRRIYAVLRSLYQRGNMMSGFYFFFVQQDISSLSVQELEQEILSVYNKIIQK